MEIKLFEKIKLIMSKCNLKQADLASVLGVSLSRIKALTTDRVKKLDQAEIKALVGKLNLNANWLATGEGEMFQANEPKPVAAAPSAPEGFILVPRYDVIGSMGNGHVIHSEQIVDHLAFRAEWVRTELGTSPNNLALISAIGDSMEPALRAHDLLLIDRSVLSVKQDAIYAFAVDGELRVKRIQRLFDGSLIIKSDNPSYATETLTAQQSEAINLVGRVVWSGRRM